MAGGRLLQNAATSGNGSVVDCRGAGGEYSFQVIPSGTITGGAIQLEEAPSADYADTWAPIGSAINPATATLVTVKVTGSYEFVRARISSAITGGGNVTVKMRPPRFGGL